MPILVVKILVLSWFTALASAASIIGPFPDGVPGSGYGCDSACDSGDVHYTIEALLDTYSVPGSENSTLSKTGNPISMFTRTFVGVTSQSSPFCDGGYNGSTGPLGPCLQVNPGQRMTIKIINNMKDGMNLLMEKKVELAEFYQFASLPIGWLGPLPPSPNDFKILNYEDLPGWDASFDDVNLHLHGM